MAGNIYMRPYHVEFLQYLMINTNPILYTTVKRDYFMKIIEEVPGLEPIKESNLMMKGYLYQEDCFFVENRKEKFKDILKSPFIKGIDVNKTVLIDHRFPSLYFSKENALYVPQYNAVNDFESSDYSLTDPLFALQQYTSFFHVDI